MSLQAMTEFETLTENNRQLQAINRILQIQSISQTCISCDFEYVPMVRYHLRGEELCPCCDKDLIEDCKDRLNGYK